MAFASEFELEDELELELLESEDCPVSATPAKWDKPSLLECRKSPAPLGTAFGMRVSGFDWKKATPPPAVHDPGRPVAQLHRDAISQIINEIQRMTTATNCVALEVRGYADPLSELDIAKDISAQRAEAFSGQLWDRILARLPKDNQIRIKRKIWRGMGAASPIWTVNTPRNRHLNRRVLVLVGPVSCGMTI